MNQKLIQINDNYGVTIDENGNTKMVSKESNDYEFQDILTKENELENLSLKLDNAKNKLPLNKLNIILSTIINVLLLAGCTYLLLNIVSLKLLITTIAVSCIPTETFSLLAFGGIIGNCIKRKNLKETIKDLEEQVPKLEKELSNIKEKSRYVTDIKANETKLEKDIPTTYYNLPIYSENKTDEKQSKVKILSLTKNRLTDI